MFKHHTLQTLIKDEGGVVVVHHQGPAPHAGVQAHSQITVWNLAYNNVFNQRLRPQGGFYYYQEKSQ